MTVATMEIARFLGLSESELMQRALTTFLQEQRRAVLQTKLEILARYRVRTIAEIDIFISVTGRYSYHWDRTTTTHANLYHHDNAPHKVWRYVSTYLKHFHDGSEDNVTDSYISNQPREAIREFCPFVRQKLLNEATS